MLPYHARTLAHGVNISLTGSGFKAVEVLHTMMVSNPSRLFGVETAAVGRRAKEPAQ
ncbi:hypothetical protein PP175_10890 [Aneurinibacillus sp. Ricciae_BoGa-3]|nr:hypothetical protein [Aneurinibacillus sp. Ricciae_BoGa-3]WCK56371.1 hypothetical protein PP175_10890 [Aneurinibacillus sp. Ricciae_BoGa-3]